MKIRVERSDLTDAVAWVARTLPTRPTVPVLAGLLLDTTGGAAFDQGPAGGGTGDALALSGFDFEVAARAGVPCTVAESGRVLVSGRLLADITRSLPAAPVDLETLGDGRMRLSCGAAVFTLPLLPVEEYPALPALPPVSGRVPAAVFANAVAQVTIAASRDDALPVLTGVRVEIEGDRLTLATTDRYRLAIRELRWTPDPDAGDLPATALIPARTLAETAKALAATGQDVAISLAPGSESLIGFAAGDRRTTTRLLDGEFPRYRTLFPDSTSASATLSIAALTEAVKRVSLVTAGRTTPVRLSFSSGALHLEAGTGEEAQASEVLDADFTGDDLAIAFNPAFLLDGLAVLLGDTVTLNFTDPKKPAVISGGTGGEDGGNYRYLLMPMRLPESPV